MLTRPFALIHVQRVVPPLMLTRPFTLIHVQGVVPRLVELKEYRGDRLDTMAVARSAQTAIDTITWTP